MFINFDWLKPTLRCGGYKTPRKVVFRSGARTHKCGIRVPLMMSGKGFKQWKDILVQLLNNVSGQG